MIDFAHFDSLVDIALYFDMTRPDFCLQIF